uniref:Glycosyltransferase RgtA/B/C/D-like domain-containing protein n=1 Tax=Solibacter usitatus (strain Ellin6076) TaxID=234267 RepID=Q01QM6_SOLUE
MTSRPVTHDRYYWTAIGVIALYLLSSLWISYHRLGWYDEVLTFLIARLPRATFGAALAGAASALPPGYFLLARLFDGIFGPSDGAMRIPSALALAGGLLVTFECARRATDSLHGLAAVALLTTSLLPYYGYEARPYAACFLLMAIAFWLWNHPSSGTKHVAALFGATFLLAFGLHYYSALCLLPYAMAETRWRFPSTKLIAGGFGVLCGAAALWPHIREARKFSERFWAAPSLHALRDVFSEFFPYGMLIAAAALVSIAWFARVEKTMVLPMLPVERLGWLFLSVPMAGLLLGKLATNAFYNRYFIGMLPGVAIAFGCALWRRFGRQPRVTAGIVALLLAVGVGKQVEMTAQPWKIVPPSLPGGAPALRALLTTEPELIADRKVIVPGADAVLGLEARYYSKKPEAYAFLLHKDLAPIGRAHSNLARFTPMRFWSMDELRAHALEAALIDPSEDTLTAMREAGFRTRTLHTAGPAKIVYLEK